MAPTPLPLADSQAGRGGDSLRRTLGELRGPTGGWRPWELAAGSSEAGVPCSGLGVHEWLPLVGPQLEVGTGGGGWRLLVKSRLPGLSHGWPFGPRTVR